MTNQNFLFKKYAEKPLDNYCVLNRFKFSLTQGGQESALQIVIQWSTYFAVCYLVAINNLNKQQDVDPNADLKIFKHVNPEEISTLDEENHFTMILFWSGVASIMSISMSQIKMFQSEHFDQQF